VFCHLGRSVLAQTASTNKHKSCYGFSKSDPWFTKNNEQRLKTQADKESKHIDEKT